MPEQEPIEKFWMVWNPTRSNPRYRHPSKPSAQAEAKRLAKFAPGEMFIVLAAVDAFIAPVMEPQTVKLTKPAPDKVSEDDIPF